MGWSFKDTSPEDDMYLSIIAGTASHRIMKIYHKGRWEWCVLMRLQPTLLLESGG